MKISLIRKEKGRLYKSEDIVRALWGFELTHDDDRAPHLNGPGSEGLFISISDTVNYWACCIEPQRVGLDMEELSRQVKPAIAKRLHKEEQRYLSALSEGGSEWTEEFFSVWTRKEAWSKYKGVGLSIDFSSFSVLDGSIEGVPLANLKYRGLMFGIAGGTEATVQRVSYDAPFRKNALDCAAGLLDARAYSSAELRKKLEDRGYPAEEVGQAIEKLKDYGYINDEALAENMVRRASKSGKASRRVEAELKDKGLDPDAARMAAEELKEGDFDRALKEALKILEKAGGLPSVVAGDIADDTDGPEGGSDVVFGGSDDPGRDAGSMDRSGHRVSFGGSDVARAQMREAYSQRQKLLGKISRRLASLGYEASVIYSVLDEINR